jgi:hypothetical protein
LAGTWLCTTDRPRSRAVTVSRTAWRSSRKRREIPRPWQAFFLFVKWARLGAQNPEGHLESDYLASGQSESVARARLGELPLDAVKTILDQLIAERAGGISGRRWWDAMRDESGDT